MFNGKRKSWDTLASIIKLIFFCLAFKEKTFWGNYLEAGKTISEGKYKNTAIEKVTAS